FPFFELPTELVLLVFKYAAKPTFYKTYRHDRRNPYSSVLALCHVSRIVSRAVLPEFLRTVLLSAPCNAKDF
ncbi:hypothetical protein DFH29DRAFT_779405, partial [Suillus ampliporus]